MNDLVQSRVASALTVALGIWLLLSPIFISVTGAALVNLYIVAGVITAAGLVQLLWENAIPSWVNILAALWLFVSAFLFSVSTAMAWNEALAAGLAFILASWDSIEIDQVRREHHVRA